jgi:DNA-binding transcriptional LysR family regulator
MASTSDRHDRGLLLLRHLKSAQLLLLIALGEVTSLRKAASSLNMTQPTATKLIQDLEAAVGVALFERSRRGMRPTPYGEVMIRHARLMQMEIIRTREELDSLAKGASGTLKIGAVISAIPFLLAKAVAALKREHPGLQVSIDVGTSDALVGALLNGQLDVLLARPVALGDRSEFDYVDLIDEPLKVVGRRQHPLASRASVTVRELGEWPWTLLPAGSPMRKVLAPIFAEMRLPGPQNIVETSSMMTMVALMHESDMLAVMPSDVSDFYVRHDLLVEIPVTLPSVMGSYGIVTRRDRPITPGVEAFLAQLQTAMQEQRIMRAEPSIEE